MSIYKRKPRNTEVKNRMATKGTKGTRNIKNQNEKIKMTE